MSSFNPPPNQRTVSQKGTAYAKKILVQMTGSIACYKACQVISRLVQAGHEVQVVASEAALKFVGEATLEGLSGRAVVSDLYGRGNMMDHIHLVRWADLILTAPATANFINKISQGIGDDLLTTQFLAHDFKKPWLIAPAMNTMMYQHPVTQASIKKLRGLGVSILEAASGVLACGEVGWGRLLEPDLIVQEVKKALDENIEAADLPHLTPTQAKKILITAGGTQEPIDEVRALTNHSTGATGAAIADQLCAMGFDVIYLHAVTAQKPRSPMSLDSFTSFESLQDKLKSHLGNGDISAVIHAAAVSDFSVATISENGLAHAVDPHGKISSDAEIVLTLKKNPKLISRLREFAQNPDLKIVGFKMTATTSAEEQLTAVKKIFAAAACDLVIHNDTHDMKPAEGKHSYRAFTPDLEKKDIDNKQELGLFIAQALLAKGL
jgi:phosphopantothenoylcysteine decarboxylase/phosphopantothenate--cysteine ligase